MTKRKVFDTIIENVQNGTFKPEKVMFCILDMINAVLNRDDYHCLRQNGNEFFSADEAKRLETLFEGYTNLKPRKYMLESDEEFAEKLSQMSIEARTLAICEAEIAVIDSATLTFTITQEDADGAIPSDSQNCIVARAFKRNFPDVPLKFVTNQFIHTADGKSYLHSEESFLTIHKFDKFGEISLPATYTGTLYKLK